MAGNQYGSEKITLSNDWKNSSGKKPPMFEYAEDFIYFLVVLPLIIFQLRCLNAGIAAYISCLLVPVNFMAATFCRHTAKKYGLFLLFVVLTAAVMFAVQAYLHDYVACCLAIAAACVSLHKQDKTIERSYGGNTYLGIKILFVSAAVCFLVYCLSYTLGFNELLYFIIGDYAAVFAALVIYRNKSGAVCLSYWNKAASDKTNKISGILFGFWTLAGSAVLAVFAYLFVRMTGIYRVDSALTDFLFPQDTSQPLKPRPNQDLPPKINNPFNNQKANPTVLSSALSITLKVLLYAIIIAAVIFLIIVLSRFVINFCKRLGLDISEERRSLFSMKDVTENIKAQTMQISRVLGGIMHGKSRRDQIRTLFLTHVKSHRIGVIIKSCDSPREITGKISGISTGESGYDLNRATDIYEKARYGKEECSGEDLADMKKALGKNYKGDIN
jgi:hypothetical protein